MTKMFSIFVPSFRVRNRFASSDDNHKAEMHLVDYIVRLIRSNARFVKVAYSEAEHVQENSLIDVNSSKLIEFVETLARDDAFFTLEAKDIFLIIPFEGLHFNVIFKEDVNLPPDPLIGINDSTALLLEYPDDYLHLAKGFIDSEV